MRDWTLLRAAAARVLDAVDVECDGATLARLLGVAEADAPRLAGAAPAPVPDVEFGAPGTLADALRHYDQGRFPEFLEAGLACLRSLVRDDLLMAARCAYAALAHWLRKARVPTDRREACARVLNAGLELQQEMLHFPWRARDAAPLYYKLRALAFDSGRHALPGTARPRHRHPEHQRPFPGARPFSTTRSCGAASIPSTPWGTATFSCIRRA